MNNKITEYTPQTEEKIEELLKRTSAAAKNAEEQAVNAYKASSELRELLPCANAADCGKILGVGNTKRLTYKTFSEVYDDFKNASQICCTKWFVS